MKLDVRWASVPCPECGATGTLERFATVRRAGPRSYRPAPAGWRCDPGRGGCGRRVAPVEMARIIDRRNPDVDFIPNGEEA